MGDKTMMRRKIHALDFGLIEMNLYLDTHPCDARALKTAQVYYQKRKDCVAEYERRFGPYVVTANDSIGNDYWTWVKGPWPWEIGSED